MVFTQGTSGIQTEGSDRVSGGVPMGFSQTWTQEGHSKKPGGSGFRMKLQYKVRPLTSHNVLLFKSGFIRSSVGVKWIPAGVQQGVSWDLEFYRSYVGS